MQQSTRHFHFQPYEIYSEFDGKPHAFTKAIWNGKECEFALALVDGWVRFCDVEKLESGEWNFAVSERVQGRTYIHVNPTFVENLFATALANQKICRLFCFRPSIEQSRSETQWVYIMPDGRAFLRFKGGEKPFEPCFGLSLLENSTSQWHFELKKLAENDSALGFSLRWNNLDEKEKAWVVTSLKYGDRKQMQIVANWILHIDKQLLAEVEKSQMPGVHMLIPLGTWRKPTPVQAVVFYDPFGNVMQVSNYYPLWEVFLRYFEPQVNGEIFKKYSSAKGANQSSLVFNLEASTTSHDQLEAHLQLAEWLKGKVPDDQIDSLLA